MELTPKLLEVLIDRLVENQDREYLNACVSAAAIYNVNRKKGSKALTPYDFTNKKPKAVDIEQKEGLRNALRHLKVKEATK